jgi:hypothetical protein
MAILRVCDTRVTFARESKKWPQMAKNATFWRKRETRLQVQNSLFYCASRRWPAGRPVGAASYPVLIVLDYFLLRYSGPSKKGGPHKIRSRFDSRYLTSKNAQRQARWFRVRILAKCEKNAKKTTGRNYEISRSVPRFLKRKAAGRPAQGTRSIYGSRTHIYLGIQAPPKRGAS